MAMTEWQKRNAAAWRAKEQAGAPDYPAGAPAASCCQAKDVWQQAWVEVGAFCEKGLSGAHLAYYWTYGCQTHQQYLGRIGKAVGRQCPGDCKWSQGLHKGQEEAQ